MDIHYLQSSTFPNSSCILVMVSAFGKPSFQGSLCSDVTGISESPGRDRWLSEGGQEVLWQGLKGLGSGRKEEGSCLCVQQDKLLPEAGHRNADLPPAVSGDMVHSWLGKNLLKVCSSVLGRTTGL